MKTRDVPPGSSPLRVYNKLMDFMRSEYRLRGFQEPKREFWGTDWYSYALVVVGCCWLVIPWYLVGSIEPSYRMLVPSMFCLSLLVVVG